MLVVTDHAEIYELIRRHGGAAQMSKGRHQSGSDLIAEAVENLDVDLVINVQGDEPFTQKAPLEALLAVFQQPGAAIPHLREGASPPRYLEHIGIYAFRKRALLDFSRAPIRASEAAEKIEALRFLEHGVKIKVVETECKSINIGTPEDLAQAQYYIVDPQIRQYSIDYQKIKCKNIGKTSC